MKKIPVVYSTDHNFVMPTAVAIKSMLDNSRDCLCDIHILQSADVTDEDRRDLEELAEAGGATIKFHTMGSEFDGLFEIRDISTPAYYRLMIPWILPEHDKVVYVDGDVIFRGSVKELCDAAADESKWVHAVNTAGYNDNKDFCAYAEQNGFDPNTYVNSGVLVINAKAQREAGLDKEYRKHFGEKYTYQDQDIINKVCKGHIGLLDRRYNNVQYKSWNEAAEVMPDAVIVHYTGPKPWNKFTRSWMSWWKVCESTKYFDEEKMLEIEKSALFPKYSNGALIRMIIKNISPGLYKRLQR